VLATDSDAGVNPNLYDTPAYVPKGTWQGTIERFPTDPVGHRDLFVRFTQFSAQYPFAVGDAYENLPSPYVPVAVHALDYDLTNPSGGTPIPLFNIDVATVTYADFTLSNQTPHLDRQDVAYWIPAVPGKSNFGSDNGYGATCFVYAPAIYWWFHDKPHHDYTTFRGSRANQMRHQTYWDLNPSGTLEQVTVREDGNDNGRNDGEDDTGDGRLDGDHPVPIDATASPNAAYNDDGAPPFPPEYLDPSSYDNDSDPKTIDIDGDGKDEKWDFRFELSPFDVNNNGEIELPAVGRFEDIDPLTENTQAQAIMQFVTHELGHNVGIITHTNVSTCPMNFETNNLIRTRNFSDGAAQLIRIINSNATPN
jgi:hypothetical protein